jgi:hypothetical protein
VQRKLDTEMKLTQRERFWSAVVAANITGGLIAKNLGLLDWDMKRIYAWATSMVMGMRSEVTPPVSDISSIVGDFINRHLQNILVVNELADRRGGMAKLQAAPILEPRGELIIRYEPDTKKMFIAAKALKEDCVERQINYKDTVRELRERGYLVATPNKRMSKGMKITSPAVHTMQFDCTKDGFIDMEGLIVSELEDADRDADL